VAAGGSGRRHWVQVYVLPYITSKFLAFEEEGRVVRRRDPVTSICNSDYRTLIIRNGIPFE
jgi:hypothetical protein